MEIKSWSYIIITIVLLALIYNFLTTIFRSDIKKFSHDRIYVDYSTYKKTPQDKSGAQSARYSSVIYRQVSLADRSIDEGRVEAAVDAFSSNFAESLSRINPPQEPKPLSDAAYEEAKKLAAVEYPDIWKAKSLYNAGKFDQALSKFNEILSDLPEKDLHHRIELYDCMAECYFRLKNQDGYVQYKVKFVQAQKELRDMIRRVFPNSAPPESALWASSEEAMTHLLRVKTLATQHLDAENGDMLIRRAEYDLAVARALSS